MSSVKFVIALAVVLILGCAQCCLAAEDGQPTTTVKTIDDNSDQLDLDAVMQMCNESFRTSMEYLDELNTTGAFPDETDKTPMCYIRCYLEAVGVIKDDELNIEKANEVQFATAEDTLEECQKEAADRTNPCEKAYFMARCVMMRNIVDMRTTGNQR